MEAVGQSRTLGLVSGLGVGAGIFYYKALVDAHLARGLRPRLLMVHADAHHVERLDGIVLAGTDLAFVFNPGNTDFPHVDGARVHIEAIMREISSSKSLRSCE